ncbi:SIMPL domain-containing protein [Motilimonas eburnea]|uniref:SIMPL domain-containing protein n=1 Tax=Motilimonas eburnea TaxID=1737488 RepID=UPI001E5C7C5D|nr:SIMPL domain-containing protein [Motilimonas eburnea]MCE2571015.1 SIMPL domain-containing protein [Motilimonas eburnea]
MRLAIFSCLLFSCSVIAAATPEQPHVITSGFAQVKVSPDMAVIEVSAEVVDKDALNAKQQLDKRVNDFIVSATKELNIAQPNIVAQTLYTHPEYEYRKDDKPLLVGYKASRQLTISLMDLDKLSQLLDLILANHLQQVNNIRFEIQDSADLQLKARKLAIEDAKSKAQMLAKSFDAELGAIYQISYLQRNAVPIVRAKSAMMMESAPNGGYLRDELTVRDEIQVVFTLKVKE